MFRISLPLLIISGALWCSACSTNQTPPKSTLVTPQQTFALQQIQKQYIDGDYQAMLPKLRTLAEQGVADAQGLLGMAYRIGQGVQENNATAIKWLLAAANNGNHNAVYSLMSMDKFGNVPAAQQAPVFAAILRGANAGIAAAQNYVGFCYANGKHVAGNDQQAVDWFSKAAKQNYAKAQFNLALAYETGQGTAADKQQAMHWYQAAASNGFLTAELMLAQRYEIGDGLPQDSAKAFYWYQQTVEHANTLTSLLDNSGLQALNWFKTSAERGDAAAQYVLGQQLLQGKLVRRDVAQAVNWFQQAAAQNNADAAFELGEIYRKGIAEQPTAATVDTTSNTANSDANNSIVPNLAVALHWYQQAAELGLAKAQTRLAYQYQRGVGTKANPQLAVHWYQLAANQGDAWAQTYLARAYHDGEGIKQDQQLTVFWLQKAAEQGNATAQGQLGFAYENGEGTVPNRSLALKWYTQAAENGNRFAKYRLTQIYTAQDLATPHQTTTQHN